MSFVHLHVHTEFSLLDGACRIRDLPGIVKAMGQTACAVTDHGVMYGAVDFYRACKAEGVKPIIGCEVYVTPQGRTRFDKVHELDAESRHLVLLCENEEGYRNLSYLVSMGWTEGFYIKPRIDLELLRQYSGGLIALSACLAGEIPRRLRNGEYENAKAYALELSHIFGPDRFYLELQDAVHAGGSLCGGGKSRAVSALLCCRLAAQALKTAGSAAVPYIRRIFLYNIRKESGRKGLRFSSICAMMRMLEE